jgi:hypothetical protein
MIGILCIIAIIWIATGTLLILYTEWTRNAFRSFVYLDHIRWYSILPLAIGIFLIAGAFSHREVFWLAIILGILAVAKGMYLIIGPPEHIDRVLDWWWHEASDRTRRLWGIIMFLFGVALFSRLV